MYGPFHVLRFQVRELPDVVCVENLIGAAHFDQINDVFPCLEALDRMCAPAPPPDSTEAFLDGIRRAS
jgi:hypothetical protein